MNQINNAIRCEIKNTPYKDKKSKQKESCWDDKITKTNKRNIENIHMSLI